MKMHITDYEKRYELEICCVTQLCGRNIQLKNYIYESIRRYYGGYKYSEQQNKWRDNVFVDEVNTGRKKYEVISISSIEDLITYIGLNKKSLMVEYLKNIIDECKYHNMVESINDDVERVLIKINDEIKRLGDVEICYDNKYLWDVICNSKIKTTTGYELYDLNNKELYNIFLNTLQEMLAYKPREVLVLFENIDHFLYKNEYYELVGKMIEVSDTFNVVFINSMCLDDYLYTDERIYSGINVFNDEIYNLPSKERLEDYISNNYPKNISLDRMNLDAIIGKVGNRICGGNNLYTIDEMVVLKLINSSMNKTENLEICEGNQLEIAYLKR